MNSEQFEKELLEREKIFVLKQKEFELKLKEQELEFLMKEQLNELEKRDPKLKIRNNNLKNKYNKDNNSIPRNPNSILNRIENEKNEKEKKQQILINRELNKNRIYMDSIEEDREKELKKILNDFRRRMPELDGIYFNNKLIKIPKTQVELSFETIKLLNNVDIDILFNSYKSLIESCIFYEKYYKIENNHRNFIDFVFDNFIENDQDFYQKFDFLNNEIFSGVHKVPFFK